MPSFVSQISAFVLLAVLSGVVARSDDNVTLDNVVAPPPNRSDEPVAKEFSLSNAARFLDSAALTWQKDRKCFTCHTNFAYLYARPGLSADVTAHHQVRSAAEELVTTRWPESGPRWDAEVVAAAAALAFNDASTTKKLHPVTRTALDRMWTLQKEDGGWSWLKCDWPPMESDDHYGVTLAAIAVGCAPENYASTDAAQKGLDGIRRYLKQNPAPTLHHEAMQVWAASYIPNLLTQDEQDATVKKLLALQKKDGGWGLATLGDWKRGDELQQDLESSDGYGTGFVIYVLRRSGVQPTAPEIQRGLDWLRKNQRESGRWFTRSLHKDNHHFISHAGTAMAVMAFQACEPQVLSSTSP